MSTWGIVVAAGSGTRFGGPKHLAELDGRPLWQWARAALLEGGVSDVVVVGPVAGGIPGGSRRQDSVARGLMHVPDDVDAIAIHDAARPLASVRLVERLLARLRQGDVDAVVPALPVADTIKELDGSVVARTLDRGALVAVQTPQVFRAGALRRAHDAVTGEATDDAAMVEETGGTVVVVEGERQAMKITHPEDVAIARAYRDTGAGT